MPIDVHLEQVMSLTGAAKSLPLIDGKRPHASTLWRWATKGLRGVKLEHVRIGHRLCTSREALSRFANALAKANAKPEVVVEKTPRHDRNRIATQREAAIVRAEASLRKAGV